MNLRKNQISRLKKLIEKNYHKKYILLNDVFFKYFFKNFLSNEFSIKVTQLNDKIIGMLGLIPCRLKYFNKTVIVYYLINLMIDRNYRGLGLGPRLVLEAEERCDLHIGTGYGDKARSMYQKLKWTEMPYLNRFIRILSSEKCSKLAEKNIHYKEPPNEISLNLTKKFTFTKINIFDTHIDKFWQRVKEKYPITIERDHKYLNWRFLNHPILKYHVFVTKEDDEIKAFIVIRIEEPPDYKIGRIIDFISTDEAEEFTIAQIVKFCKENEVDLIDFFFTGSFHISALKEEGFVECNKEPLTSIPILFNPIDRSRKYINFAFKLINKDLYNNKINDIEKWYITKADGDQDRPN